MIISCLRVFYFMNILDVQFLEDQPILFDEVRDKLWPGTGKICGNLTDAKNVRTTPSSSAGSFQDSATSPSSSGPLAFYQVDASRMDIKFRLEASTQESWKNARLKFVVTSFLSPSHAGTCARSYFSCGAASGTGSSACISQVLLCNGVPNCGFRGGAPGLDEANCPAGEFTRQLE